MSRNFFCAHCNHRIIESSDPNMDFIHVYTSNAFCDVSNAADAVSKRGGSLRKTATPKLLEVPATNQTLGRDRVVDASAAFDDFEEPAYAALMIGYEHPSFSVVIMSRYDYEPLVVDRYEEFLEAVQAYISECAD